MAAAPAITSSTASGWVVRRVSPSPPSRVMVSRFSTMWMSHRDSSSAFFSSSRCFSAGSVSCCSSTVLMAPEMAVSGVRRSWPTARSRLPRVRSFSFSACSRCRSRARTVMVLVRMPTTNSVTKVTG